MTKFLFFPERLHKAFVPAGAAFRHLDVHLLPATTVYLFDQCDFEVFNDTWNVLNGVPE